MVVQPSGDFQSRALPTGSKPAVILAYR